MSISTSSLCKFVKYIGLFVFILTSVYLYPNDRRFRNFSISDGLADMDVLCLAQDSSGLIWLGTNAGVQSYDGYAFTTYDYYGRGEHIYNRHNRIISMSCSKKLLWVGSESGLTCIDMNTRLYTKYVVDDCEEIRSKQILRIDLDTKKNLLWIYTNIRCYVARVDEDHRSLSFLKWENPKEFMQTKGKHSFCDSKMWELGQQHLKYFWVENNLVKVRRFLYPRQLINNNDKLDALTVTSAYAYLRTESGCYRIPVSGVDRKPVFSSSTFMSFHQLHFSIPQKTIDNFFVDERSGDLWCPYWGGLFHITKAFTDKASVRTYFRNTDNVRLSKIQISSILLDRYDNLWVGTTSWGLYCKTLHPLPFHEIRKEKFLEKGFYRTEVNAIAKQGTDKIWMIVESSSLFCYNEQTEELTLLPLQMNKDIPYTLQSLHISSNGKFLYIGMYEGLLRYEIATGKELWMIGEKSSIINKKINIFQMKEDQFGRLWAGGWFSGLYGFESPQENPKPTYHISDYTVPSLSTGQITDIEISKNYMLLATTKGLNKLDFDKQGVVERATLYQVNSLVPKSMSSDCLSSVEIENDSTCWIGTVGGGLNKLVIHSSRNDDYTATVYTRQQGMPSNNIDLVYYDHKGNVWTGGKGISCLNTKTGKIFNYDIKDGLQASAFKLGAGFHDEDGTIYMGGSEGMNYFRPKDFIQSKKQVDLVWSGLYIDNKLITPLEGDILNKTLDKTESITLAYNQDAFSISFSALGYQLSDKIVYRYRLQGYEKSWNVLTYKENRIYYTNVPDGNYTLQIQVSTDNGDTWENPGRELIIEINPPLWLCWWAKLLYTIIGIGILYVILYQYNKAQQLKRETHFQELLRKKDEEKYQSKMIFFMNLSHELKTPLTLIMLAVERIRETQFKEETRMILSNAKKMLQLITEMVDIRKTDLGINELHISSIDIQDITARIVSEISCMATDKNIEMSYSSSEAELLMEADSDRIGKMVVNICSNAVKYTPRNGKIEVILTKGNREQIIPLYKNIHMEGNLISDGELCILTVRDSGVGISAESISHIYERFFQVKGEESSHLGSGIGLAIVKNAVLIHGGMVIVSSERGIGTEITIALPLNQPQSKDGEVRKFEAKAFIENHYSEYNPMEDIAIQDTTVIPMRPECPILLIVEDNKEMQDVLSKHFNTFYNVRVANNGREGLELCESLVPDIIVSDVMMPEMDGVEMCRHIRNNLSIAYLPIVLLTAKSEIEDQIEGYESGADLYLSKPFSMKLLEASIRHLLEKKQIIFNYATQETEAEKLNEETERQLLIDEETTESTTRQALLDEEKEAFRSALRKLIEENLSNPDLSVDFCCQQMCMGKTKLWQRVKECCGESLAEHVRNIRLDKAEALLRESTLNITEIKFEVGFINSSHFTRSFKQKFGVSPSEYLKQLGNS